MGRAWMMAMAALGLVACGQASAATIAVVKDPNCGCCAEWVEHLRAAGFAVTVSETARPDLESKRLGVPEALRGCHSATVEGYVIEGHVPAKDIARLLEERPKARGLAVPGMPSGSPGMSPRGAEGGYTTVVFDQAGSRVFARH